MTINTDKKTLRNFGLTMAVVLGPLFGLFFPWLFAKPFPLWPWWVTAGFLLIGAFYPLALKYPHWIWMKIAHVLGWMNTRILLTLFFYLFVTPVGLVRRLFSKNGTFPASEKGLDSYRESGEKTVSFERPF